MGQEVLTTKTYGFCYIMQIMLVNNVNATAGFFTRHQWEYEMEKGLLCIS